ncbi:hypothetical protein NCPPB3923_10660 [Burkholderia glumae]|nr:hypothetical protein NCPPB3923_10660 [Burkholderia glumae]
MRFSLYEICSTSCRSLRMLYSTCNSIARVSFSGAMLGRPLFTSTSYIAENFASIFDSASFSHIRIWRSGCACGTNSSSLTVLNNDSL